VKVAKNIYDIALYHMEYDPRSFGSLNMLRAFSRGVGRVSRSNQAAVHEPILIHRDHPCDDQEKKGAPRHHGFRPTDAILRGVGAIALILPDG